MLHVVIKALFALAALAAPTHPVIVLTPDGMHLASPYGARRVSLPHKWKIEGSQSSVWFNEGCRGLEVDGQIDIAGPHWIYIGCYSMGRAMVVWSWHSSGEFDQSFWFPTYHSFATNEDNGSAILIRLLIDRCDVVVLCYGGESRWQR